ncbi:MAG: SDR family NAD(P)-dependent oxidoreductase, partial [Muribaculaceae bacterium]|nr:SDR family NAD(P)-dependent oxidoreductase [Muribaculaceae bacterium]
MKHCRWHTALVTGAASGLGLEFCCQLASLGCRLILVDRSDMTDAVSRVGAAAVCMVIRIDLTTDDAVPLIMQRLSSEGILPDLLINNAGIFDFRSVLNMSPGRIDAYIDLHIRAVTSLCRAMAPLMVARGSGDILVMSSMSCWMPMPGIAMYSATKAYLRVFSRALRVELADTGVNVTVACPGGIATDLFGLPRNLQRLGVRLGALSTVRGFVASALKRVHRRRAQYVNG